jgi:catechol-2,3-dioxygenase
MAILSSIPVLNCQSIKETSDFYQQILQFVVVNKREMNGELRWVHLMHGSTTLMLQAVEQQFPEPATAQITNIILYLFVNNINDMHHYIKARYKNVSEMKDTDYKMLEFTLTDPEGNIITLGQKA